MLRRVGIRNLQKAFKNSSKLVDTKYHSCGITTNDAIYCWGAGNGGRLGNTSTANQSSPVEASTWP